jgi:hypothetical protein
MSEVPEFVVPVPRAAAQRDPTDASAQLRAFLDQPIEHGDFGAPRGRTTKRKKKPKGPPVSQITGGIAWAFYTAALICFHMARPEAETMFERFRGRAVRGQWDHDLVPWIIGALALDLVAVTAGIMWVAARHGRLSISLTLQGLLALGSLIAVLVLL